VTEETVCANACRQELGFDFTMAFQPVVDMDARTIYAHEALVRGPAGEPAAWVLGQVTDGNRYAFDQACRVKAIELAAGLGLKVGLNVNFLPNAVYHPQACLRATLAAAARHDFPLDRILFEFTENERVMDRAHLRGIVAAYRDLGFQTALDDFGSGYAGLDLLADFRPDVVKIDRSLIAGIDHDMARQAIVEGVLLTLGKLGVGVVAEGVERREELAWLRRSGISRFQGYLFAHPRLAGLVGDHEIDFAALAA
jgi:EAL domain-containing protein (putative c-di-GMP-specific phosphodiesterase class I)